MSTLLNTVAEPEQAPAVDDTCNVAAQPGKILMVDDQTEETALAEIRRSRIAGREIVTALSAADAMGFLAEGRFDGVIAGLRDLNDSLGFLQQVAASHSSARRFLRAEVCEINPEIVTKHTILPRAWNAGLIDEAINRSLALAHWQSNPALVEIISAIHKIPTLPTLYTEITEALKKDCSAEEIAQLISKEPGITAKLIQFVNSGQAALNRRISNPVEAVMFFGTQRLRTLVLLSSMFTRFDGAKCAAFSLDQFFKNSLQVATWSSAIAMSECKNKELADLCFTSGLLHDFGVLLLASSLPERCKQAFKFAIERKISADCAEFEIFGITHADLGGFILATWNLPFPIINAVGNHHTPSFSHDTAFTPLTAVHIATAVNAKARTGNLSYDKSYMERIGMAGKVEFWADKLAEQK